MIGSEKREELLLVPNVRDGRVFLYPRDVVRVLAILLIEAIHVRTLSVSETMVWCLLFSTEPDRSQSVAVAECNLRRMSECSRFDLR